VIVTEPVWKPVREAATTSQSPRRELRAASRLAASQVIKNVVDVVAGSVLSLLALPVLAAVVAVLAIRMRQQPFFLHRRMGKHGKTIAFPKLRTLPKTTPRYACKDGGKVIPVDRFCAFLRHRHLDELPQLFLVPLLKMSLVGPRPKMPDRWEPTDPGYRQARQLVRQGCTGLWQIGDASHRMVHEHPEFDFCYLQHGGVRMDLWILWRTGLLMLGGRSVGLDDIPRWALGRGWVSEEQIRAYLAQLRQADVSEIVAQAFSMLAQHLNIAFLVSAWLVSTTVFRQPDRTERVGRQHNGPVP
jgi:lipopolysaccharide/colanic/teichoic acid biosynthesis glycosyltransferase